MDDANFKVFVRCRVKDSAAPTAYDLVSPHELLRKDQQKKYQFDRIFSAQQGQEAVFEACALPLVDEFLRGFNGTVFAYGQTGTGKTFTMTGDCGPEPRHAAGIVPRVLRSVFQKLEESQREEWSLELRYVELYNEELRDLLDPTPPSAKHRGTKQLRITENTQTRSTEVLGATSHAVTSYSNALSVIRSAQTRRQTAATLLNSDSSRSHTVLTLVLVVREPVSGMAVRSKLHLVDLAGSESIAKSGAQRQRAVEAGEINKSLLALGRVIEALVEAEKVANGKPRYISYRSSKLTQLLQDSLGGATKTSMVATVSLAAQDVDETRSTLDYASRARSVKNQRQTEVELLDTLPTIKEMSRRLEEVQLELAAQRSKDGSVHIPTSRYEQLTAKEQKATKVLAQHETAVKHERARLAAVTSEKEQIEAQLREVRDEHRQCSIVAKANTRLQQAIAKLSDASHKHTSTTTKTFESLLQELGALPEQLAGSVETLRRVLESPAFHNGTGLQDKCDRLVGAEFHVQRERCKESMSRMLLGFETQLNESLGKAMRSWQRAYQDLQRSFKDANTLTEHLKDQLEDVEKQIAEVRHDDKEMADLTRRLDKQNTDALHMLMETLQKNQSLTRLITDKRKQVAERLPNLSSRAASAGQCAENLREVLSNPPSEPSDSISLASDMSKLSERIPNTIGASFDELENRVKSGVNSAISQNIEEYHVPQREHIRDTADRLTDLHQSLSRTVNREGANFTAFRAKVSSFEQGFAGLQQQVNGPTSPRRAQAAHDPRSPTRSPVRAMGSLGSPSRPKSSLASRPSERPLSSPSKRTARASSARASSAGIGRLSAQPVLQSMENQVSPSRLNPPLKARPSQQGSENHMSVYARTNNARQERVEMKTRAALRRPPDSGRSAKRVKTQARD